MKLALKVAAALVLMLVLAGAGVIGWATRSSNRALARSIDTHRVDFPVPFPLEPGEADALGLDAAGAEALALERARERGRHLVESRYVCMECHGKEMSGGVMVDNPAIGRLLGPNLTTGAGSRTAAYTAADWDRTVRHGVLPDGRPAAMPSVDFRLMSDRELSDVVAFVRSLPPVDNAVPAPRLGPLGRVLVATGKIQLSADLLGPHEAAHAVEPPEAAPTAEFGEHLAGVCAGCHGPTLAGGPIAGGDPSWPAAANLTPHADALGGWSYDDFRTAMTGGTRPDGTALAAPMAAIVPIARNMTDVEIEALWAYLRTVPPVAPAR